MFITTLIIQASNNSISPIISLYIQQLLGGHGNVTLISGVIASIPGIATLIAAPRFGRLGDRIGSERILTIGLILAIFVYLPMAFVQNVWRLAMLRFLVGISDACLLPAVQTLITRYSPSDAQVVFSVTINLSSDRKCDWSYDWFKRICRFRLSWGLYFHFLSGSP